MAAEGARIVLNNIGYLLRYVAAVPVALAVVGAWFRDWDAVTAAALTTVAFFAAGWALSHVPTRREPRLREGMFVAAIGWLLVPLVSVIPFMLLDEWRFLDAYFETMSAWTGTGMSVADVRALSPTLLAWRSLMQWVGGLGVIVLTLSVLARPGTGAFTLYASEGREDKLRPSVLSTVRTIWWIYAWFTVGAVLLLLAVGLPFFHAFNHALTGIATGGMSITAGSIGEYRDPAVEWAIIAITVAGAIPFIAHYALVRSRWRQFLGDAQVRGMVVAIVLSVLLLAFALGGAALAGPAVREAVFQGVSAVTTSGFQTANIAAWPEEAKIGLVGFMLLGGAAGSTAGGLKLVRGVLLVRGTFWKLERSGLPHFAITPFRFGGRSLGEAEANEEFAEAAFIGLLWMALLFVGVVTLLAITPDEVPVTDVIFDLASAQGNVGLSAGVITPDLADVGKVALMAVMWAGRLEILPVLLLIRRMLPFTGKR